MAPTTVGQRNPNDPHVQYSAVSSFVFLRFFAFAVLSPHTFQLRPHHPFLDEISSNVSKESSGMEDSVVLKEGEVHKRAQGKKRIGKKNFKKRWLRVTNVELSYHKQRGESLPRPHLAYSDGIAAAGGGLMLWFSAPEPGLCVAGAAGSSALYRCNT
ncbi:hypothetical protein JZ751_001947 [Albula glossodonta]|uniref:Ras-GAP domain-containing protein n=1 Tax=Albula glossodonta TaxID=121402 RepID=A0A8T2PF09_9TELE|nr:hypothetical protein JZ751_001947 [Albula glossodonta]